MLVRRCLGSLLLLLALTSPLAAHDEYRLSFDPSPLPPGTVGMLIFEGVESCAGIQEIDMIGRLITVYFENYCAFLPPEPRPFRLVEPIGPLEEDEYVVQVRLASNGSLLAQETLQVEPITGPPPRLELSPSRLVPGQVGDAIALGSAPCPAIESVEVSGSTVAIFIHRACPLFEPDLIDYRLITEIGPFDAGTYTIELREIGTEELHDSQELTVDADSIQLQLIPDMATTLDSVEAEVSIFGACGSLDSVDIGDARIEIVIERGCVITPPPAPSLHLFPITLGRLEAGNYTVVAIDALSGDEVSHALWVVDASPPLAFEPEEPTEDDSITIVATVPGVATCALSPQVSLGADRIDIVIDGGCLAIPPGVFPPATTTIPVEIGSLPSGTYTVRILNSQGGTFSRGRLKVLSTGACIASRSTLCLSGGRFQVRALYDTGSISGPARAVPGTQDSGSFTFFNKDNVELVVKVLDGCPTSFNSYWVFVAGLTNVGVTLEVLDTEAGVTATYINQRGNRFQTILDTRALETCP